MTKLDEAQNLVDKLSNEKQFISDGYHSFEELYTFRKLYNALLFNEWAKSPKLITKFVKTEKGLVKEIVSDKQYTYDVHKSLKHHNGELCFGGGWFIVVAILPSGQITNHYKIEDWDLFKIPEYSKAKYEFDGHSSKDVIERLLLTINK